LAGISVSSTHNLPDRRIQGIIPQSGMNISNIAYSASGTMAHIISRENIGGGLYFTKKQ